AAHSQQTSLLFDVLVVLLLWCFKYLGFMLIIRKLATEPYCSKLSQQGLSLSPGLSGHRSLPGFPR
ncbi:hypothetical protein N339_08705, partial [Pterocles gutturalis]